MEWCPIIWLLLWDHSCHPGFHDFLTCVAVTPCTNIKVVINLRSMTKATFVAQKINPANIYLFKVSNRNTRISCEVCSKLTIKTPERLHWGRSGVFIVNFEHISHLFQVFLLLILDKEMLAGKSLSLFPRLNLLCCQTSPSFFFDLIFLTTTIIQQVTLIQFVQRF